MGLPSSEKRKSGYRGWRWLHGLLALAAAVPLLVQGLTGALLAYEREIRNGLGDGAAWTGGPRLGMEALHSRLEAELEGGRALFLIWYEAETEPVRIRWEMADGRQASYLANPVDGAILPSSTRWHRCFEIILDIHRTLGLSRPGQVIMGSSALVLCGLLASGLVLQAQRSSGWRRFFGSGGFRRKRGKPGWKWLHATLGVWLSPVLLIIALTGAIWSFAGIRTVIGWLSGSEPLYGAILALNIQETAQLDLELVLRTAEALAPDSGAKRLRLPERNGQPARFEWAPESAPYENFRSRVWLHPESGTVLHSQPLSDYTPADRMIRWAYPVHIGKWGGELTRILHFAAALSVPFFTFTGLWLYIRRKCQT